MHPTQKYFCIRMHPCHFPKLATSFYYRCKSVYDIKSGIHHFVNLDTYEKEKMLQSTLTSSVSVQFTKKKKKKKNIFCSTSNFMHCFLVKGFDMLVSSAPYRLWHSVTCIRLWNMHWKCYCKYLTTSAQIFSKQERKCLNNYKLFLISTTFLFQSEQSNEKWTLYQTCKI